MPSIHLKLSNLKFPCMTEIGTKITQIKKKVKNETQKHHLNHKDDPNSIKNYKNHQTIEFLI